MQQKSGNGSLVLSTGAQIGELGFSGFVNSITLYYLTIVEDCKGQLPGSCDRRSPCGPTEAMKTETAPRGKSDPIAGRRVRGQ